MPRQLESMPSSFQVGVTASSPVNRAGAPTASIFSLAVLN
jgi:hypothetical protein